MKKNGGSTSGVKLATTIETSRGFPTISGPVTFSPKLHSVDGRPWRIMTVKNNKESFVRCWKTKKVGHSHVSGPWLSRLRRTGGPETLRATAVSRSFEGIHALR